VEATVIQQPASAEGSAFVEVSKIAAGPCFGLALSVYDGRSRLSGGNQNAGRLGA
jgi:hypothetical protein